MERESLDDVGELADEELNYELSSPGSDFPLTEEHVGSDNEPDHQLHTYLPIDESQTHNPTQSKRGENLSVPLVNMDSLRESANTASDETENIFGVPPADSSDLLNNWNTTLRVQEKEDEFIDDELDYEPSSPEVETTTEVGIENLLLESDQDSVDSLQSILSSCDDCSISSANPDFESSLSSVTPMPSDGDCAPNGTSVIAGVEQKSGCIVQTLIFSFLRDFYKDGPDAVAKTKCYKPFYSYWEQLSSTNGRANGAAYDLLPDSRSPEGNRLQKATNRNPSSQITAKRQNRFSLFRRDVLNPNSDVSSQPHNQKVHGTTKISDDENRRRSDDGVINSPFSVSSHDMNDDRLLLSDVEGSIFGVNKVVVQEPPPPMDCDVSSSTLRESAELENELPTEFRSHNFGDIPPESVDVDHNALDECDPFPPVDQMCLDDSVKFSPTHMDMSDEEDNDMREPRFLRTVINQH